MLLHVKMVDMGAPYKWSPNIWMAPCWLAAAELLSALLFVLAESENSKNMSSLCFIKIVSIVFK